MICYLFVWKKENNLENGRKYIKKLQGRVVWLQIWTAGIYNLLVYGMVEIFQ